MSTNVNILTYRPKVTLPPLYYTSTPNQSTRRGQKITGIVIHETEGNFIGAVGWLMRPATEASAHGVLNEDGTKFAQLVPWGMKAWHAENANPYTLGLELAGFTRTVNNPDQIVVAARIVGYWCTKYGIAPQQAQLHGAYGLCRHVDLGEFGGGHHDPGGFLWSSFIKRVAIEVKRGGFRPSWGKA